MPTYNKRFSQKSLGLEFFTQKFSDVNEVNNQLQKTEDEIKLLERDIGRSQADSKPGLEISPRYI